MFEPFVRLESHLLEQTPGTGLGLYLTRKMVTEVLGGQLDVDSQPGEGSTFLLQLPIEHGSRGAGHATLDVERGTGRAPS